MEKEQLRLVIVGHVDHGKSTLIGRLIHDTGSLPDGKFEQITASCAQRSVPFEWSFLMDALQAERAQGITIDMTQIWLRTITRDYVISDAPGHHEFLKNMMTGAAESDAAILIIDAVEGMREQTRKHAYLLHLLGVTQVIALVNKMDAVGYDAARYHAIAQECTAYLADIGIIPIHIIPASAYKGEMLVQRGGKHPDSRDYHFERSEKSRPVAGDPSAAPQDDSTSLAWYQGATLMEALAELRPHAHDATAPLRFPVQDVYKFDTRRIIAGTIESGSLKVGDEVLISPSNYTARIASIEGWGGDCHLERREGSQLIARGSSVMPESFSAPQQDGILRFTQDDHAIAGQAVGITLEDQRFIERGHVISHLHHAPILTNQFFTRLFWMHQEPLVEGASYDVRINTAMYRAEVKKLLYVVDTNTLEHTSHIALQRHQVAEVLWQVRGLAVLDAHASLPATGRCVVMQDYRICGGGIIHMDGLTNQRAVRSTVKSANIVTEEMRVTREDRAKINGHTGGILWFTGLSGSGKSTLAKELQQRLFALGYQVYVLDGDNIRQGLNADLGFTPDDRSENIRRVGEVAALFADAGMVVISAFISPYRADRHRARSCAPELFHTVHIKAGVDACAARDVKGLYGKARRGEIAEFTGISAPYETPDNPELVIDTEALTVQECVDALVAYVVRQFGVDGFTKSC
jgi:bifunctional enzyme CysN/CysC